MVDDDADGHDDNDNDDDNYEWLGWWWPGNQILMIKKINFYVMYV